jgi:hypothetical protein
LACLLVQYNHSFSGSLKNAVCDFRLIVPYFSTQMERVSGAFVGYSGAVRRPAQANISLPTGGGINLAQEAAGHSGQ